MSPEGGGGRVGRVTNLDNASSPEVSKKLSETSTKPRTDLRLNMLTHSLYYMHSSGFLCAWPLTLDMTAGRFECTHSRAHSSRALHIRNYVSCSWVARAAFDLQQRRTGDECDETLVAHLETLV